MGLKDLMIFLQIFNRFQVDNNIYYIIFETSIIVEAVLLLDLEVYLHIFKKKMQVYFYKLKFFFYKILRSNKIHISDQLADHKLKSDQVHPKIFLKISNNAL